MLILLMTVSFVFTGSFAFIHHRTGCYGRSFELPIRYSHPLFKGKLYFTQSDVGSRTLIMDSGEAKIPRLKVSHGSVSLLDLTESDTGIFSVSYHTSNIAIDVIKLTIKACADAITRYYGGMYVSNIPRWAEFLEFRPPRHLDPPRVLWNRTDPQANKGGRLRVKNMMWEMRDLTQADNGYYNFRRNDSTLLSWILLSVKEHRRYYNATENDLLLIHYPETAALWTLNFTRDRTSERHTLMIKDSESKKTPTYFDPWHFQKRITPVDDGIEIFPVKITDSGTFGFSDSKGNLALTAMLVVKEAETETGPTYSYIATPVGIVLAVISCCCTVRKCCCKKSSSKRDEPAPETEAAPAVHYHLQERNNPTVPSYSDAPPPYQLVNPHVSIQPKTTSLRPPVYSPVSVHENLPPPEAAVPGGEEADPAPSVDSGQPPSDPEGQGRLPSDPLSAQTQTFELKGLSFPSAPPLNSDSTSSYVYTSDKLNFL